VAAALELAQEAVEEEGGGARRLRSVGKGEATDVATVEQRDAGPQARGRAARDQRTGRRGTWRRQPASLRGEARGPAGVEASSGRGGARRDRGVEFRLREKERVRGEGPDRKRCWRREGVIARCQRGSGGARVCTGVRLGGPS
jgi:hypothetical protein